MIWFIALGVPVWMTILVVTYRVKITCDVRRAARKIEDLQSQLSELQTELALLEALTDEDKEWLDHAAGWTWPTISPVNSYAIPTVGSIWEWDLGNPWGREVVTVRETRGAEGGSTGSVWLTGPSGDRVVSLPDFARDAVPAPLGRPR